MRTVLTANIYRGLINMLKKFLYQVLLIDIYPTTSKESATLPVKLGGIGIIFFADIAQTEYQNSINTSKSLTKLHLEQTNEYKINRDE